MKNTMKTSYWHDNFRTFIHIEKKSICFVPFFLLYVKKGDSVYIFYKQGPVINIENKQVVVKGEWVGG